MSICRVGIPFGFQTIIWTFARHLVSRGLYSSSYLRVYMGCALAFVLQVRSLYLSNGPLFRVRFGESLVFGLYSEIDHLHLSSEAQCVSHLLPLGDCHNYNALVYQWDRGPMVLFSWGWTIPRKMKVYQGQQNKIWQKFAIFTVYNRASDPLPTSIFTEEFLSDPILRIPFMAQVMLKLHIARYYSLEIVTLNIKSIVQ